MKFYFYLILFLLGCDNPLINNEDRDCIIELGGFYDDCNICSGGITNHIPNSDKDCNDICFGYATLDGCSTCDDIIENDCNLDCNNVENGFSLWDDCGDCVGGDTGLTENNLMDDCGVCFDSDSEFDQNANSSKDLCGVCNGSNISCNLGLLTLQDWSFSKIEFWNNSDCYGIPSYILNDTICLENNDNCFSYVLDFSIDLLVGALEFTQTINFDDGTDEILTGQWSIDGQGICLDYALEEYQDECYDIITFESDYFDCENNLSLCQNNSVYFTLKNNDDNQCSKESYNFFEEDEQLSKKILLDSYEQFPAFIKNIIIFNNTNQ